MIRDTVAPRPDWQAKVEARGLIWHTNKDDGGDKPYWDEGTFYRFDRIEVDLIEGATAELYRLFLEAGQAVIDDPNPPRATAALRVIAVPTGAWKYVAPAVRVNDPPETRSP